MSNVRTLNSGFYAHRYTKPLTPEFQAAADKLAKQQAELDAHMRERKLDQARARMQGPQRVEELLGMRNRSVRPSNQVLTKSLWHDTHAP